MSNVLGVVSVVLLACGLVLIGSTYPAGLPVDPDGGQALFAGLALLGGGVLVDLVAEFLYEHRNSR